LPGRRKKVLFYAAVRDPALFRTMGFYATDIKILEDCGYEVTPTNRLLDFFKYGRYDLAFIYFWTKGLLPAIVAKGLGKKVLFTGGIDALDRGFNRRALDYLIKKWLFRACAALSDANIIVSLSDLANVRQTGVDVSSLHLVPMSLTHSATRMTAGESKIGSRRWPGWGLKKMSSGKAWTACFVFSANSFKWTTAIP